MGVAGAAWPPRACCRGLRARRSPDLGKSLQSTWQLLRPHVRPRIGLLLLIVLLGTITTGSLATLVLLIQPLIDTVLFPAAASPSDGGPTVVARAMQGLLERLGETGAGSDPRLTVLWIVVLTTCALSLLGTVGQYCGTLLSRWTSYQMVIDLRMRLARHLMGLSVRYHGGRSLGDLLSRVSADVQTTLNAVLAAQRGFIKDPLEAAAYLSVAFLSQPWLTLSLLLYLPLIVWPVSILARYVRRGSTRSLTSLGSSVQALSQMFQGVRAVKAFRAEERELEGYREINDTYLHQSMKMSRAIALTESWSILFSNVGLAAMILAVGWAHLRWGVFSTAGAMTSFFLALSMFSKATKSMTRTWTSVQESVGASERLLALFDEEVDVVERPDAVELASLDGGLRFEHLSFAYPEGEGKALDGIDLELRPGETLAIVGPSGSGKSTLVDLVCRFIDPTEGRLTVGGVDLREATVASWNRLWALVDQIPFLFHTSIAENLRYGKPDATEDELIEAARAAHIHDFIASLPDGYETNVADQGTRLSGGERQRITIARALLKNAPLLILDEATSSLDSDSERRVQEALDRLMQNRTVIVVAHRLSTIQSADRIAVLEHGKLVELGPHAELLARGGTYARLCRAQKIA